MFESAAGSYRRLLVEWVELVRRFALVVVLAAVAATGLAIDFVVTRFAISTETADMLSRELPFRRNSRALSDAFPQFSDNIVVVVDADNPDLADDAAALLAEKLRQRPALFGRVYDPVGLPFFRRNGLLFMETGELSELTDRLAEAQPFLGTLWGDTSLRGLFEILGTAIDETLDGVDGTVLEIASVLDSVAEVVEAQVAGRYALLSWRELMAGKKADPADRRRLIVIRPALDFDSLRPAAEPMEALRLTASEAHLDPEHGVHVRLTGSAALAQEELESVEEGMGFAAVLSLTLVVVLLFAGLRSARLIAATVVTLIMGLVWTAAFAFAAIGSLNLISVAFAVLFIGLSVDFAIHFGLRVREAVDGGADPRAALGDAAGGVGGALTLCAVAAAIGFFSFLPTDYIGLAELGLIAGVGMFIALFANLTVLPALVSLMPVRRRTVVRRAGRAARAQAVLDRHGRAVAYVGLALAVAASAIVPAARFDFDPLNLKDPETESVSTVLELLEDSRTSPYSITILSPNLKAADALAERVSRLEEVEGTSTLSDYVPADQDEKLAIIEEMALFLSPAFVARKRQAPPGPDQLRDALAVFQGRLERLADATGGEASSLAARCLLSALSDLAGTGPIGDRRLAELETRLVSLFPERMEMLRLSLDAEPVRLDDLPKELRDREVAADGRARLEVFPRENVHDRDALGRFVKAVRSEAPDATGSPVVILEAGNAVVAAFRDAAVLAVVAIAVLLAVLLRSVRDVALVFAPLLLAALLTVSASVVFDLPFNFANVIVLPLLFGLGVANGIHLVLRERDEGGVAGVAETSTPRAVVFSALTTIGSFGSIAISSHPGTSSMGTLLTIAIALSLVCTLIVLPALMTLGGRAAARRLSR